MTVSVSTMYHFLWGNTLSNPFNKAENLSEVVEDDVTSFVESILS